MERISDDENNRDSEVDARRDVTRLLHDLQSGGEKVEEQLVAVLYDELRGIADHYMRSERPDHTLQPTALVHEAYFRLADQRAVRWQDRAHFLGVAAQAMRRILVDHARRHCAVKRGGGLRITLSDDMPSEPSAEALSMDLLALDGALERLALLDPRQARIVELRFFAGLGVKETAAVLEVSPATVKSDWRFAKAWLSRELMSR
ncbi:MAG: sigma-70 family RNA polymerase sigma factor [Chloroflexi bacterium]|nr:sigma-70 family RNA polymerase sigma factor [Chloroflexota bacterium]